MENGSYLKQASYVANPSYFNNILHEVECEMWFRQATQDHRTNCKYYCCKSIVPVVHGQCAGQWKCPENVFGKFFPKYWNIGGTTIFVSNVTMLQHAEFLNHMFSFARDAVH